MQVNDEVSQLLSTLGLGERESAVYVCLISHPNSSTLDISKNTGIARSSIYRITSELLELGFITSTKMEPGETFSAITPNNLWHLLQAEQEKLESKKTALELLTEISQLASPNDRATIVESVINKPELQAKIREHLHKDSQVIAISPIQGQVSEILSKKIFKEVSTLPTFQELRVVTSQEIYILVIDSAIFKIYKGQGSHILGSLILDQSLSQIITSLAKNSG